MSRARLERRVGSVRDEGCQRLEDYRHAFAKLGTDGSAKGAIVPTEQQWVYGVVYDLSETQLHTLSKFEGGYRRIVVPVGGEPATTFEPLPHLLRQGLTPTRRYVRYYLDGMREHGFPADYVNGILKQLVDSPQGPETNG